MRDWAGALRTEQSPDNYILSQVPFSSCSCHLDLTQVTLRVEPASLSREDSTAGREAISHTSSNLARKWVEGLERRKPWCVRARALSRETWFDFSHISIAFSTYRHICTCTHSSLYTTRCLQTVLKMNSRVTPILPQSSWAPELGYKQPLLRYTKDWPIVDVQ